MVVRRIFDEYATGKSPKAIARDLNRDRIPPPRGTRAKGWTWTALVGNAHLGTGILNNSLYVGKLVWNASGGRRTRKPASAYHAFVPRMIGS